MMKLVLLMTVLVGCGVNPANLRSRQSTDLEARKIRRIAVVPAAIMSDTPIQKIPFGTALEQRTSEREAPESLTRFVYLAVTSLPNWQIVSDSEVREVSQSLPREAGPTRVRQIGEMVYADAVLIGRVQRYRERVGDEWGARTPASVAFVLDLVDVRRGDVVWSATFDETQKSLSENIFALGDITARGVRWLSADQLAQDGVKKAVSQLHQVIARAP